MFYRSLLDKWLNSSLRRRRSFLPVSWRRANIQTRSWTRTADSWWGRPAGYNLCSHGTHTAGDSCSARNNPHIERSCWKQETFCIICSFQHIKPTCSGSSHLLRLWVPWLQVLLQTDQELQGYRSQKQARPAEKQQRSCSSRKKLLEGAMTGTEVLLWKHFSWFHLLFQLFIIVF